MKKIVFQIIILCYCRIISAACTLPNGFSTGAHSVPNTILFNSNIDYAYTLLGVTNQIVTYTYDKDRGALKRVIGSEVNSGGINPTGSIDPDGKFLYVTNKGSNTIAVFRINNTTGNLTKIQTVNTVAFPYAIAISPNKKHAYVSAPSSNKLLMYNINSDGTLSSLYTLINRQGYVNTGNYPFATTFSPSANYLYVANYGQNTITRYQYNSQTGDLTYDENWSLGVNSPIKSQQLAKPYAISFDYSNNHAIVFADQVNKMFLYNYDNDLIIPNPAQDSVATGINPNTSIQWYQNNQFTYMGNFGDNTISEYRYNSDGTMINIGTTRTITRPSVIRQPSDPEHTHLFVLSSDENCIVDYNVNPTNGHLEPRFVNTESAVNGINVDGLLPR